MCRSTQSYHENHCIARTEAKVSAIYGIILCCGFNWEKRPVGFLQLPQISGAEKLKESTFNLKFVVTIVLFSRKVVVIYIPIKTKLLNTTKKVTQ